MIGMLWLLIVWAACAVAVLGAFADRWLRWTAAPWWWVTVIGVELVGIGQLLGAGYRLFAALLALYCCAAGFYLRKAIVARRLTAARHRHTPDAWERL